MKSFKTSLQKFGLSMIGIHVYFYGPVKKQMFHNAFLPSIFLMEKSVMIVFGMVNIHEEYIKTEKF